MRYTVDSVVCDWGVYEENKLILILNSYSNAVLISKILNADWENKRFEIS